MAAIAATGFAQTTPKTSTAGSSTTKTFSTAKTSTTKSSTAAAPEAWIKLPPGVPRVPHGPVKIPFALRYEDIKIGAGVEGEPEKVWHIKYTGWRAADGIEFDSWEKHAQPVIGKDGKPEMGPDGKPKLGEPEPLKILQGVGRVIPGFDYGVAGMRIGGKRRIFIPWQMAYGTRAIPDRPDHPGIPAKSDLIFDVELVDVTEMPQRAMPPNRPMPQVPPHPGASAQPNAAPAHPAQPTNPAAPAQQTAPAQPQTQQQAQPK